MKLKSVFRLDQDAKLIRLFRLVWKRGQVGDGKGYSAKFSMALTWVLRPLWFRRGHHEWWLWLLGLRFHYLRSYGGIIV